MATQREIESKFEVSSDAALPDLAGLPGVTAVDPSEEIDLQAVYVDTPALRLAQSGITLRRRTGGADEGWHLKLPVAVDERIEVSAPLGSTDGDVPVELISAVRAMVRNAPLAPVAVLHTRRTVHRLRDETGRVLAEVADDVVTSRAPGAGEVYLDAWREWEVELVEGDRGLLAAATDLLVDSGAATSAWSSKLARALGGDRVAPADAAAERSALDPTTAGGVLGQYVRDQRDELLSRDAQVRRDEPDAVHRMRVATRRLRSALATFGPLLVREPGDAMRAELGWLAALLGAARDAEVARSRCAEMIAAEPAGLVVGPVARRLDVECAAVYRASYDDVIAALDSSRYFQLLDALDALADRPPWTESAAQEAGRRLPVRARRDWDRLAAAVKAADQAVPGPDRERLLHEARKAAKRARYAGEVAIPAIGRPAMRSARSAEKLADLLGRHHDSVEMRAVLERVAVQAQLEGESTFTYGRLHALEQAHADWIEEQLPALRERVSVGRHRRWLR